MAISEEESKSAACVGNVSGNSDCSTIGLSEIEN